MVKLVDLKPLPPDDPIYREGLQVYTPRSPSARKLGPKEAEALRELRRLQLERRRLEDTDG